MRKEDVEILEKVIKEAEERKISADDVLAFWILAKLNQEIELMPKPKRGVINRG